ncbi:MAG: GNAT family N-acetyltransferase [Clostridia bacterium]|nr:GNAT family N-acetyltransferase [Clostridia bacterium]
MSELVIKEFYGKDVLRYKQICTKLFRIPNKELENEEAYTENLINADKNRDKDFVRLGAFYEDTLYAAIEMIPFDVYMDGEKCRMYGIGGVVSDPECPVKGAVKLIYSRAFEIMREKNIYLSHLYPFEVNYYRQYGYEVSCQYALWKIPLTAVNPYKNGQLKSFDNSEMMKNEIKDIYNKFASEHNMTIIRNESQWNDFFKDHAAYTSQWFSYIHYTDGIADAFMCYKTVEKPDRPMDLETDKFWFTSFEGLRGILSYFLQQKSYAENIIIKLPVNTDLSAIIDSCGGWGKKNASQTIFDNGTSKIIDVQQFFKHMKCKENGTVSIKINDAYCPWNNDCFKVTFGEETSIERGGTADIELDIKSFTSLMLGRYDFDSCRIFPDVKIFGNEENLRKLLRKKSCWIEEHF